jgi:FecR protein
MTTRNGRFELEWWVVQKRMIYILICVGILGVVACGAGLYVWVYGNPFRHLPAAAAAAGARFISFEGDVRVIRSSTRETISANSQIQLYPGDTIQTQTDGRARIGLADGSTLVVRPNSTIIIRDNTNSEGGRPSQVRVQIGSGQINVRTDQQPDGTRNVVETPQTKNQIASLTGASFGVNPNDHSEEIRVSSGQIETTSNNGEKMVLKGGEYAAINPAGTISRQKLLDVPEPQSPRDLEKISANKNGTASVPLHWQKPVSGTAAHYRVEVATSPFFVPAGKVIERDQLGATDLEVSDLRPGNYFWRVRATAPTGQVSDWTEAQKFVVVPVGQGMGVSVNVAPPEFVGGNIYVLRGKAEPGTTVSVTNRETIAASDGTFQLQITAPDGAREVLLEAMDPEGNKNQYKVVLDQSSGRGRK